MEALQDISDTERKINERKARAIGNLNKMSEPMSIAVVVPAYNEVERIVSLQKKVDQLREVTEESNGNITWKIVVVDEGSTDDTFNELTRYAGSADEHIIATRISDETYAYRQKYAAEKRVQMGAAIATGFEHVTKELPETDYVVYTDFDDSVPLWEIGNALPMMQTNTDLIIGSRREDDSVTVRNEHVQGYGSQFIKVWRELFPKVAEVTKDTNGAFHVWKTSALPEIVDWAHENHVYSPALKTAVIDQALQKGMRVNCMGITFIDVAEGSKFAGDNANGRLDVYARIVTNLLPFSENNDLVKKIKSHDDLPQYIAEF